MAFLGCFEIRSFIQWTFDSILGVCVMNDLRPLMKVKTKC